MAATPEIIAKVQKLLSVHGRTPEEAAQFVAKAQAIMEEHGLAMEQVAGKAKTSDVIESIGQDIFEQGKPGAWRMDVLRTVAKTGGCQIVTGWRTEHAESKAGRVRYRVIETAYMIGLPGDVEIAGYTYAFLIGEMERLAKEYADVLWGQIRAYAANYGWSIHDAERYYVQDHGTHPLKAQVSWLKGAAEGVVDALTAAARERTRVNPDTMALVVNRDAIVRDYIYMKRYGKTYAEWSAEVKVASEKARAAMVPAKPLTPAQQRKVDERQQRANERWWRTEANRQAREAARLDGRAYRAGVETGRRMTVRPGVREGSAGRQGELEA